MHRRTLPALLLSAALAPSLSACAPEQAGGDGFLLLARFAFDPLRGDPPLPDGQRTEVAPGETDFHLLQLVGPTQDEWLEVLAAAGVELIQFQPAHAYIVRMTPEIAAQVAQEPFVRAVAVYHAAYRVAPSLPLPTDPVPVPQATSAEPIENVDVTLYDDGQGSVERVLREIEALGGQLVEREKASAFDRLATATVVLPPGAVLPLAQRSDVLWLNYRQPLDQPEDEMSSQLVAGNFDPLVFGYGAWLAGSGLTGGMGVTVGLVDSGYDTGNDATSHPDLSGRLTFVGAANDQGPCAGHGTHVGGIIAGNAALGTMDASSFLFGLGVAPAARLVARRWTGADPTRTMDMVVNGAVASNHSYRLQAAGSGYTNRDRTYDFLVRDADQTTGAVAEPLIIVFSAGNSGNAGPTKEAKNIIAVANTRNQRNGSGVPDMGNIDTVAGGSSRGPAQDGRTYPHVAAPGTNVVSTRFTGAVSSCGTIATGAPAMNPTYSTCSGTSMAAPHVTGAVALLTEWWRGFNAGANPSPAIAKALLVSGAVDVGTADVPNNVEGWGRIHLGNVINPAVGAIYRDQATTFGQTGDSWSLQVSPSDLGLPMRITVAWSDAPGPGSGGNTAAWVNDLDLSVLEGQTADTFLGNVFAGGFSTPGGAADLQNNVESVFVQSPGGAYEITVAGSNIAGDGVPLDADGTDQDFAFVCWNCEANDPPVCDANGPYEAECAGPTTAVTLDGTASFDPNGGPLDFTWTGPFAGGVAVGDMPTVDFAGTGAFVVDLEVSDGLATDMCSANASIVDTQAPVVSCATALDGLWPPNHDLVDVGLVTLADDTCEGPLPVDVAVFSDEDDDERTGQGRHSPDARIDPELRLRTERKGNGDGRIYLILATAEDGQGQVGFDCCTVTVPKSQRPARLAAIEAEAAAVRAFCQATGMVPADFVPVGDGPVRGPKQ